MKCLISINPPEGFNPTVGVAACYCEWTDKILLLRRHPEKPQGNTWALPAGKMENNETPRMAVIREIQEEIGLDIDDDDLIAIGCLYCRLPNIDFIYHMFRKKFSALPDIKLQLSEHLEMKWVTVEEALKLPLIFGEVETIKYYKENISK